MADAFTVVGPGFAEHPGRQGLGELEKRLVVELGETAQVLARRYPREAETMVRRLGPEGLSAVRVFGDDVAELVELHVR